MIKDADVMNALECCAKSKCKECSFNRLFDTKRIFCTMRLSENAFKLIKRLKGESNKYRNQAQAQKGELTRLYKQVTEQKAEIERLQTTGGEAVSCFTRMESLYKIKCEELEAAKSEAIKEFWKMLKSKAFGIIDPDSSIKVVDVADGDNLVKEVVEGDL